jgi:two-component system sensor histidine kinase HydH
MKVLRHGGPDKMKIKALLRYLPVLSIVLVAGTLLVIVILFTLRNINSQNERMEEFTSRQGVSVIRTLEAGTRTGFMEGDWGIEHLQMLIEQAAKDPDVEWVGLINSDGIIMAHSEPAKIGLRLLLGGEMNTVNTVIRTGNRCPSGGSYRADAKSSRYGSLSRPFRIKSRKPTSWPVTRV